MRLTEQDIAAIKIQTKYRQYLAKRYVNGIREERAAIKIQAGYHGWVARKEVQRMRSETCDVLLAGAWPRTRKASVWCLS